MVQLLKKKRICYLCSDFSHVPLSTMFDTVSDWSIEELALVVIDQM